ncbi:hypothetical protein GALL_336930 [mine drainage metagenome]|uniref:Uncharacterized protein n=1 Tax=mine drainage metagenome TaxID=410659 RepID=A0A1J5QLT9_9ZZZZ
MAQRVRRYRLGDAGCLGCATHMALQDLLVDVMATPLPAQRIGGNVARRKHVLPAPGCRRIRILLRQRAGQPDAAPAGGEVRLVQCLSGGHVGLERPGQRPGQHGHPILAALAIAHADLESREVHILDPQPHALHQAHAGAIEQPHHQGNGTLQPIQHRPDLGLSQHRRQARRLLRPHDTVEPGQLRFQYLTIEKQDRRQRKILRRGCDLVFHRQTGQESLHLRPAQFGGMPLAIEINIALYPMDI